MIDSLFNQQGETTTTGESKLYVNWHSANNPQGELYAFLVPAVGSVEPPVPSAPPQIAFIDPDTQEIELRREIVRFLNQATFGATPDLVDQMFLEIQNHPQKDRMAVFEQYLDDQLDESTTPQSRIFEITMAADWHEWVARGYYDSSFFEESDWDYYLGRPYPGDLSLDLATENWPGVDSYDPDSVDYTKPLGYPQPTADWPVPFSVVNQSVSWGPVWPRSYGPEQPAPGDVDGHAGGQGPGAPKGSPLHGHRFSSSPRRTRTQTTTITERLVTGTCWRKIPTTTSTRCSRA